MPNSYECGYCGKQFEAYRDNAKYCSTDCRDEARGGKYRDKEWLQEKYVKEGLKVKEIASLADCTSTTIHDWLNKHDIEERGMGYRPDEPEKYRDKDWLHKKYHDERLSTSEIGEICDCSKQTIKFWLERHGIDKRTRSEAAKVRLENNPKIARRFIEGGKKALEEHGTTAKEAMSEDEFTEFCRRLSEERTGEGNPMWNVTGEDNPAWKENKPPKQFYQSKKWTQTRRDVLDRDNHSCQVCNISQSEYDRTLEVHHITPLSDGGDAFDLDNLITMCKSCHQKWEGLYLRPDTR